MGVIDPVPLDQAAEQPLCGAGCAPAGARRRYELIVLFFAAVIFLSGILSPPSLMDDVDSVQAQIARNMLSSGDWVTARLDGVMYLEKAPLKYWMTAVSYMVFGVHDWSARLPIALSAIALAWLVFRFGSWAFSAKAGFYAGLVVSTCVGLFLFTRVIIPDVIVTLAMTLALWSFLRALDENELAAAAMGIHASGQSRGGRSAEGPHRNRFPAGRRILLPCDHAATGGGKHLAAPVSVHQPLDLSCDRRTLACAGDTAKSAVSRLQFAQRARASGGDFSGSTLSTSICCGF